MNNSPDDNARNAARAQRAISAMYFFPFGGAWIGVWAYCIYADPPWPAVIAVAIASAVLLALAYRVYRANAPSANAEATAEAKRNSIWFNVINASQLVFIFIIVFALARLGQESWTIPAILVIIGAHFMPLARVFANPPYYLTGVAMIVWAILYPFITSGPGSPAGCLGAGLILWASSAWAISPYASGTQRL